MHAISRFWIYKRLNNCAAPVPDSDDVSVLEKELFLCAGHAKEATTKISVPQLNITHCSTSSILTVEFLAGQFNAHTHVLKAKINVLQVYKN